MLVNNLKELKAHLEMRGLQTDSVYWVNEEELMVVFPLYDSTGNMIGYHNYRPNKDKVLNNHPYESRYFTRVTKGWEAFYGYRSRLYSKTLFVTEGLWDAERVQEAGFSCYTLFSNNPKNSAMLNLLRKVRPVVALCDGDKAGRSLAKFGHESVVFEENRDANDYTPQELKLMLTKYD